MPSSTERVTTLDALRSVAGEHRAWTAKRDGLVRQAHTDGHSLRAIAEACGLSHSGVKRIIDRQVGSNTSTNPHH